ncbi:glycoside hydrolase family 70 protein [Apilactobacillus apinorum]|uniref:glycoside hydrolase family 70 protein n=1 Tax=Apilactobacillus apinorum TaxID=1218495 RepID=UPI0030EAA66A
MIGNERKSRYKMYKSGKHWIVAAITTSAIMAGITLASGVTTLADQTSPDTTTVSTSDATTNLDYAKTKTDKLFEIQPATTVNSNDSKLFLHSQISSNASADFQSHLKVNNSKIYYYYDNGKYATSTIISDNNVNYYFGSDGSLTSSTPNLTSGQISSNSNISAYSTSKKNFNNFKGYLLADTWYRPKKIQLANGTWRKSTSKDFRPLLSVWWPNRNVELDYLNFMSQHGFINGTFDANSNSNELNQAVATVRFNIEKQIANNGGNTYAISKLFSNFIKSESRWNKNSENYDINDGFQGGSLKYVNNKETPQSNSKYRLLNRTPTQQNGKIKYNKQEYNGYEFLLGSDVDNSNPVVQAETLNWLHYMMNIGSIAKKDASANFDGVRVDAVDNMDADVINIIADYFKAAYKVNQSDKNANAHLQILEDWSDNDAYYQADTGTNQMTIDTDYLSALESALMAQPNNRANLAKIKIAGLVNRTSDVYNNYNLPNYTIVRAHDTGVQDVLAKIIKKIINPKSDGYNITQSEINKAFKIYNADQQKTDKQYTQYNIPSAYALLLTNKDTVPRVYYGDMYTDDGQFMATKSPYYQAIATLLKGRIKYVSGGQAMNAVSVNDNQDTVLTSVRYGSKALTKNSKGNNLTRNSGIAVVESNNPNLKLSSTDKVVIQMGAAHKNQAYRQLLATSDNGIATYDVYNKSSKILYTDSNGNLTLDASEIKGYANPQVSGYLSVWVPLSGQDNQDIREQPSKKSSDDGQVLHSNPAMDSNVIFEAFSNFQDFAKTNDQYTNVVISKQANLFKQLGFTYVELAPQYRSVDDSSFLDSVVQNGYAFNDRYDLGYKKPTKYGTITDLLNAIKAMHQKGIKVLADIVPDQLYSLPNTEVVSAVRVNTNGDLNPDTNLINTLYQANSKGSGDDYQFKYGGAFLGYLKQKYPKLFTQKQISTGQTIDASKKIKVWSAKYLNGSNIQEKGVAFVLGNTDSSGYFKVGTKNSNLPNVLIGKNASYGLVKQNGKYKFITTSGQVAKSTFLKDNSGNWYYVDAKGNFVNKPTTINGYKYYFLSNGINMRDVIVKNSDNTLNYYQNNGAIAVAKGYITLDKVKKTIYVNQGGKLQTGFFIHDKNLQYFDRNGYQIKDKFMDYQNGKVYLDPLSGDAVAGDYFQYKGNWYYANASGHLVYGLQTINGKQQFFSNDGILQKNVIINTNGKTYSADFNGILKEV